MEPIAFIIFIGIAIGTGIFFGRLTSRADPGFPAERSRSFSPDLTGMRGLLVAGIAAFFSFMFFSAADRNNGSFPSIFFGIICFMMYWLMIPTWVYRDAKLRGGRATAWALLVFFTNALGLFSYLITRPDRPRACLQCGFKLREDFLICPYCGPNACQTCSVCQSIVEPGWRYCPFCQSDIDDSSGHLHMHTALPENRTVQVPPPAPISQRPFV